jgi:hypothetical protein
MSNIGKEFQEALEERDGENNHVSQLLGKLKAEKAQNSSELQLVITTRDIALAESQRIQLEIYQLQQQLESTNTALQDHVPWNGIQLVLDQTRRDGICDHSIMERDRGPAEQTTGNLSARLRSYPGRMARSGRLGIFGPR